MSNGLYGNRDEIEAQAETERAELDQRPDIIMARDKDTDPSVLKVFAETKDQRVRSAALMNPSTPAEIVEEAIFEGTDEDAIAAGHNPAISESLRTIAQFRYVDILPLDGELSRRIRRMSEIVYNR